MSSIDGREFWPAPVTEKLTGAYAAAVRGEDPAHPGRLTPIRK
ncbi:hypothetical protein OIE66_13880 [Nonomuraea sp. NBC_01738]|nr:hypothetical protein OIE66_13880 [Nonomuraea sp. NBC_01738]